MICRRLPPEFCAGTISSRKEILLAHSHWYLIHNFIIPEVQNEIVPCRCAYERCVCSVEEPTVSGHIVIQRCRNSNSEEQRGTNKMPITCGEHASEQGRPQICARNTHHELYP